MASPALRSVVTTPLKQDMVAPGDAFVGPDGTLTPVSFRFLFKLWNALGQDVTAVRALERDAATKDELAALRERVAALEARP